MERSLFDKLASLDDRHWMIYAKKVFTEPYLGRRGGKRILDAGCGTGSMLGYFSGWGEAVGLDSSSYALSLAKRSAGDADVTLVEADAAKIPFPDGHFDVVTLYDVLYHRAVKDEASVLKECVRVLKNGGRLIVVDSAFKFLRTSYDDEAHVARRYTLTEMRGKITKSGLKVRKSSYIFFFLFPVVAVLRYFHNVLNIRVKESDHMFRTNFATNSIMRSVMWLESAIVRFASLPCGTSLFCVGVKE